MVPETGQGPQQPLTFVGMCLFGIHQHLAGRMPKTQHHTERVQQRTGVVQRFRAGGRQQRQQMHKHRGPSFGTLGDEVGVQRHGRGIGSSTVEPAVSKVVHGTTDDKRCLVQD